MLILNRNSRFQTAFAVAPLSKAVSYALEAFQRDLDHSCLESERPGASVILKEAELEEEMFRIRAVEERQEIEISAADDLGFIYGIYWLSRNILGVKELWFWNDQEFQKKDMYPIPESLSYRSERSAIRYRGWFINDEVLLDKWNYENDPERK